MNRVHPLYCQKSCPPRLSFIEHPLLSCLCQVHVHTLFYRRVSAMILSNLPIFSPLVSDFVQFKHMYILLTIWPEFVKTGSWLDRHTETACCLNFFRNQLSVLLKQRALSLLLSLSLGLSLTHTPPPIFLVSSLLHCSKCLELSSIYPLEEDVWSLGFHIPHLAHFLTQIALLLLPVGISVFELCSVTLSFSSNSHYA